MKPKLTVKQLRAMLKGKVWGDFTREPTQQINGITFYAIAGTFLGRRTLAIMALKKFVVLLFPKQSSGLINFWFSDILHPGSKAKQDSSCLFRYIFNNENDSSWHEFGMKHYLDMSPDQPVITEGDDDDEGQHTGGTAKLEPAGTD